MPYNNRYTNRDRYADDNKYIRESNDKSPLGKVLGGILAIAGIAAVGKSVYKSGGLRGVMESVISGLGEYKGNRLGTFSQALKVWGKDDDKVASSFFRQSWLDNLKSIASNDKRSEMMSHTASDIQKLKKHIDTANEKFMKGLQETVPQASGKKNQAHWLYSDPGLVRDFKNFKKISSRLDQIAGERGNAVTIDDAAKLREKMIDRISKRYGMSQSEQAEMVKQSGHRFLTLGDMFDQHGNLTNEKALRSIMDEESYGQFANEMKYYIGKNPKGSTWRSMIVDKNILIHNETEKIANLTVYQNAVRNVVGNLSENFHIPFIHINPMNLFYLQRAAEKEKPIFAILSHVSKQPGVTGDIKDVGHELYFIDGDIYGKAVDSKTGRMVYDLKNPIKTGYHLEDANAAKSTVARYFRKMSGINIRDFEDPDKSATARTIWNKMMKTLDIGFQDDIAEKVDMANPMSYMSLFDKLMRGPLRPANITDERAMADVFGDATGYIAMKDSVRLRDVANPNKETGFYDYAKQYFVSRNSLEDVTPLSLIPYAFFERLNAGFASFGFGLRLDNMKSASDIYKNLMLRRVLPIAGGVAAWGYLNYESEKLTGVEPEDEIADGIVHAKLTYGSLKDMLGITDLSKEASKLLPGGEQIMEIPGLNWLDLSKSATEMEKWYESGVEEVRKGRFWSIGNTPFTGGKIEYYRPNWYRRLKSDWQYTDSLYGSKDEYYENAWFPTPRYPLAPVRHFLTDNRHMEERNYNDRPYMVSEGIPEIKGIPLIGPILDDTIGQLLKPTKKMHPEYWEAITGEELNPKEVYKPEGAREMPEAPVDIPGNSGYTKNGTTQGSGAGVSTTTQARPSGAGVDTAGPGVMTSHGAERRAQAKAQGEQQAQDTTTGVYITASGNPQPFVAPGNLSPYEMNRAVRASGLSKGIRGVREKYAMAPSMDVPVTEIPGYNQTGEEVAIDVSEMGGIYGFSATDLLGLDVGNAFEDELATPDDMDSFRDRFWELNMGGLGGEASEIYRRFIPRDKNKQNEFNPVRNTQAGWMPGSDYFLDLQHGDPYRMPYGELRVPGEAFEKVNNLGDVASLPARGSMLGYTQQEMIDYFFHKNDVLSEAAEEATSEGDRIHKKLQRQWAKDGALIDAEVQIKDEQYNYTGHYDARVVDATSPNKQAIVDVKTVNQRRWDEMMKAGAPFEHHVGQVNAYLHTLGMPKGYIYYVNRDDKEAQPVVFEMWYNDEAFKEQMGTLQSARDEVNRRIETGEASRGDLYDYWTRWKTLADVAPYSQEFKEYSSVLSSLGLTDEQKKEAQEIKSRITEQKKRVRTYDYKYSTANLQRETVHVSKVLSNTMFLTEEYPDNPIKLAGIKVSDAKDNPIAKEAQKFIGNYIHEGAEVQIGYDADDANKISKDTYGSIRAVVEPNGRASSNLNRMLLENGLATEKEEDYTPASVHARFSQAQIAIGSTWERIAHLDTFINTKMLQVRSPKEQYERREVYGKDFQSWSHPIRDYIQPTLDSFAKNTPVIAVASGAIAGMLFGKGPYGKVIGSIVGGAIAGIATTAVHGKEAITNEKWIPERRRKERDINEYMDILKFIKARRLFAKYAEEAKDKDDFDVIQYLKDNQKEGDERKREASRLLKIKKQLKFDKITYQEALKQAGIEPTEDVTDAKSALRRINKKISNISDYRRVDKLPDNAVKAIMYYQQSERTAYGYDSGEPIENLMAGLPKKERQYFQAFIKAPDEEKADIIAITPKYMRRGLESMWGLPVEEKTDLKQYFQTHQLPSAGWEGWNEDANLDVVKTKIVKHEALDATEFGIWPDDEEAAAKQPIRAPQMNVGDSAHTIKRKLEDILHGIGLDEVSVSVEPASHGRIDVDVDVENDRQSDIQEWLRQNGHTLLS